MNLRWYRSMTRPGRADDDLGTLPQGDDLLDDRFAAHDERDAQVAPLAERFQHAGYLLGEFHASGHRINARMATRPGSTIETIGAPNASVLPVPVSALAITSRPARTSPTERA